MALDLRKYKEEILAAWKDVSDPNSSNTWAIFGYEGQTGVLKVVESGDGDFEEMVENLNSGKIQYSYCRVTDPNTNLPKFVLVNWQGDGAPDTLKGRCATHTKDVAATLRGAHLTVNARDEADLDQDDILKQVAKSSGSNYSVHKEKPQHVAEQSGPIGSVYKKTLPGAEIKISERDKFWDQTYKDEQTRIAREKEEKAAAQRKIEEARKQRELEEAKEREKKINQHSMEVQKQREAESHTEARMTAARKSQQEMNDPDDDYERRTRSESLRKQRAAEAASLVKQRENNPREMFKQRERAGSQDERLPPVPAPKKAPRALPPRVQPEPVPEPAYYEPEPVRQPSPPPREPSPVREPSPPPREPSPPPCEPSPPLRQPSPEPVAAPVSQLMQGLPPRRQDSDEEEEEQDWDAPTQEDDHVPIDPYAQSNQPVVAGDGGMKARAIYDYQAGAEDEVSFDPGDLITEIEQVDEGWWIGTAPDGRRGLFPANYVEVI